MSGYQLNASDIPRATEQLVPGYNPARTVDAGKIYLTMTHLHDTSKGVGFTLSECNGIHFSKASAIHQMKLMMYGHPPAFVPSTEEYLATVRDTRLVHDSYGMPAQGRGQGYQYRTRDGRLFTTWYVEHDVNWQAWPERVLIPVPSLTPRIGVDPTARGESDGAGR